jgi:hypothetical protein
MKPKQTLMILSYRNSSVPVLGANEFDKLQLWNEPRDARMIGRWYVHEV